MQRQLLELAAGTVQLLGQLPAKVRLLAQVALGQQPLLNGGLLGQVRLGCAPLHLLQGAQGVGQQAQVMALQSWQQRCFELLQLADAERTLPVVRRGGIRHRAQARGVSLKPQEWPASSRQCTRSTWQSGKVWRISCNS